MDFEEKDDDGGEEEEKEVVVVVVASSQCQQTYIPTKRFRNVREFSQLTSFPLCANEERGGKKSSQ